MSGSESPLMSPMARPAPLCATAVVKNMSPSRRFVKATPVVDEGSEVKPGRPAPFGVIARNRYPSPCCQVELAAKVGAEAAAQTQIPNAKRRSVGFGFTLRARQKEAEGSILRWTKG